LSAGPFFPGQGHRVSEGAAEDGDALALAAVRLLAERAGFAPPAAAWPPLSDRLRNPAYSPPALLPLTRAHEFSSSWTWLGDVERFELVKACQRSRCPAPRERPTDIGCGGGGGGASGGNGEGSTSHPGDPSTPTDAGTDASSATHSNNGSSSWCELSDSELAWVVGAHEVAEGLLSRSRPAEACVLLVAVLDLSPSDVLAHVKLALALLAADTEDGTSFEPTVSAPASGAAAPAPATRPVAGGPAANVAAARRLLVPVLLRHALQLEPLNAHLRALADLVLRVLGGAPVPDALWGPELPRSPGIDLCLLAMLRR
jgi:hypothetical protein